MKKISKIIALVLLFTFIPLQIYASSFNPEPNWKTYRGSTTITYEDGAMYVTGGTAGTSSIASIYFADEQFTYYEMTAEFTVISKDGSGVSYGSVYRTNNNEQGIVLMKLGSGQVNPRAVKRITNVAYSSDNDAVLSSEYTPFTIGETVSLKTVVSNVNGKDVVSSWAKVLEKDEDYRPMFENITIPSSVGVKGYVGFFLSKGVVKFDNIKITDTETEESIFFDFENIKPSNDNGSEIVDREGSFDIYSGSDVTLNGSTSVPLNNSFVQMPDTFEAWFKTEATGLQPIIDNYRNGIIEPNPYRLQLTNEGKVRYYEMNGSDAFSLVSQRTYRDGAWYRTAVTREFDKTTDKMLITLYVFDENGGLLEKVWQSKKLDARKLYDYGKGDFFTNLTPSYIGSDWFHGTFFKGNIGEINLWNRALSEEELTASHIINTKAEGLMHNLAYFDTDYGITVFDKAGGGLHGIVSEMWLNEITFYDNDYSILFLPDPQRLVKFYPAQVDALFEWILDNAETLGIKLVLSVGDLVHDKTQEQSTTISNAAKKLLGKIPFLLIEGNHDINSARELTLFNKDFSPETWRNQEGYAGSYSDGTMSNSYYKYNFDGNKYLFLMLEIAPRDAVITWANQVITEHPDYQVIVSNHAYLDVSGTYLNSEDKYNTYVASNYVNDSNTDAQKLWDNLISRHENIRLVFSGHMGSCDVIMRSDRGLNGNIVHTFNIDAEKMDSDMGGIGAVTLLGFSNDGKNMGINYYSVSTNRLISSRNQFILTLDSSVSYVGYQNGEDSLRLVGSVDSDMYSEVGFDALIYNLADGESREVTVSGNIIYTAIKNAVNDEISASELGNDYLTVQSLELLEESAVIIVTPFSIKNGVRENGQKIIISRVNGQITQEGFFG